MTQRESPINDEHHARKPQLSKRAIAAKQAENPTAEAIFTKIFGDQYAPEHSDGLLNVGVAENTLMSDWLLEHYKKHLSLNFADLTYGDALNGSKRLLKDLSNLFQKYFKPITPVKAEHMVCGVGVSAVLDQLSDKLCDEGEGMLIATPYYNGFDNDLGARSLVNPISVELPPDMDPASPKTLEVFEAKIHSMKQKGEKPARAVILCNPNNPLGFIYPKETILEYCRFCERHNLHLIVDEIYALSLYKNKNFAKPIEFQSVLSMDVQKEAQCDPARVHVLYGMSKDFGSNGLRIGLLVSQHNPDLIKSFAVSNILMKVSSPADALWCSIIGDEKTLDGYLTEAQSRASDALNSALEWLESLDIKHSNPVAGHFIWIDLRSYLPKKDRKGKHLADAAAQEAELFNRLLFDANVYVAPGMIYHSQVPGYFRFTFTVKRDYMKVGMKRIEDVLKQVKKENEQ